MRYNLNMNPSYHLVDGRIIEARWCPSSHCDARPEPADVSLLVLHNISLPPREFGTPFVEQFFSGQLPASVHPYFETIKNLRVSSHFFLRRDGELLQFVATDQRAWHAGVSSFQGRECCNDYALGIELEGSDDDPYTESQYRHLVALTRCLQAVYPAISVERITGHQHIAPGRKTDPGPFFDWDGFRRALFLS